MMAARRSACVAPEVNVRNNSVQALKRARECTVALKTREDVSKRISVAPSNNSPDTNKQTKRHNNLCEITSANFSPSFISASPCASGGKFTQLSSAPV